VLISSDFYNENSRQKKGSGGVGHAVRHILVDNPRRFLAFVPLVSTS